MDLHLALSCAALAVAVLTAGYVEISCRRQKRRLADIQEMVRLLSEAEPTPEPAKESWRNDVL